MYWLVLAASAAAPDLSALVRREADRQACRSIDPGDIVVCGRQKLRDRYRTVDPNAPFDVHGNVMSVIREKSRWLEGGEAGPGSCSAVGPGGWTGCLNQQWKRNDQQNPNRKKREPGQSD